MQALSESDLLQLWEKGRALPIPRRALIMLHAGSPDLLPEELAQLHIGARDRRLLHVRELTFGQRISGLAQCENCREQMELNVTTRELLSRGSAEESLHVQVMVEGYHCTVRLPGTADLLSLEQQHSSDHVRRALIRRCIVKAEDSGLDVSRDCLPDEVIDMIPAEMAEADSMAELRLTISCPYCQRSSAVLFDIVQYFWEEIVTAAKRILYDIHGLARAYGWSEAEILAVPPVRRRLYLEMVGV